MRCHHFLSCASQRLHSIRLPAKAAMQVLTTLLLFSLFLLPTLATAATPHIYDAPNAGPPGSQTRTVGNGWDPNATLDIYFDSMSVGLVDTDNNGSFGMTLRAPTIRQNGLTIQIPNDAIPGQHWITAVERITQLQAQAPFTVWGLEWPQWHYGPDHTGFNPYESILSPETVGNLTTKWTYTLAGDLDSASSPVVANGMVYFVSFSSSNAGVYALNADTGALVWRFNLGVYPNTMPAVVNGVLYFVAQDGIYALNALTGAFLWRYEHVWGGWGGVSVPAVANGMVYVSSNDGLYALDAKTGTLMWTNATWDGDLAVANGVVYFTCSSNYECAVDARTGELLWTSGSLGYITTPLAVANGVVYVGSHDRYEYALDAKTGALIWKYLTNSYSGLSSPAVANGVVYVGGGWVDYGQDSLLALDATTGALLWEYDAGAGLSEYSPAVANGVVYISSQGTFYALNASTGTLICKRTGTASDPAVVNGMIYISGGQTLYALGLPSEQKSEKLSPPQRPDPARLTPDWSLQPSKEVTPPLKK